MQGVYSYYLSGLPTLFFHKDYSSNLVHISDMDQFRSGYLRFLCGLQVTGISGGNCTKILISPDFFFSSFYFYSADAAKFSHLAFYIRNSDNDLIISCCCSTYIIMFIENPFYIII